MHFVFKPLYYIVNDIIIILIMFLKIQKFLISNNYKKENLCLSVSVTHNMAVHASSRKLDLGLRVSGATKQLLGCLAVGFDHGQQCLSFQRFFDQADVNTKVCLWNEMWFLQRKNNRLFVTICLKLPI